jgi:primase-polymerase (primpol)-like protein
MNTCKVCGIEVHAGSRGRKPSFCGGTCRVRFHRGHHVPIELRELPRWIRHSNKVPITTQGNSASSTNPLTWSDYQTASQSTAGDGLGFVLNGDGLICIDLDHCFDGEPSAEAQALIDLLPPTYIEVSPSGTGLHLWGYAALDKGRRFDRNGLSVEVYPNGRYLTVTGNALIRAPFQQIDLALILP